MEKTLATVVENNTKIRATFEQLIASQEERAMYNEWVKLWESYKKGTEEVMALSRKAIGQIPREAHDLNTKIVNKIGLEADAVLKKSIDLNNSGADKAAQGGGRQLCVRSHDAGRHPRRRRHHRHRRQLLSGPRRIDRDCSACR